MKPSGMLAAALLLLPLASPSAHAQDRRGGGTGAGARLRVPAVLAMTTLVLHRYDTPPPWPRGNCLSLSPLTPQQKRRARERYAAWVRRPDRQRVPPPPYPESYNLLVLNMHTENFQRVVGERKIDTVEVERVGKRYCLIVDARIPREWLLEAPCRHCTTESLRKELLGSPRHAARRFRKAGP